MSFEIGSDVMSYAGPHVEYVLAAEFDIDSGPTVKYQYPTSIDGDQHLIAELMSARSVARSHRGLDRFFPLPSKGCTQSWIYHIQNEIEKQGASKLLRSQPGQHQIW